jgi:hypothetical protein
MVRFLLVEKYILQEVTLCKKFLKKKRRRYSCCGQTKKAINMLKLKMMETRLFLQITHF